MAVDDKTKQIVEIEPDLSLVMALWGGTRTMREAGKEFLPQEPGEETDDYQNRKSRTTLTNIFKKTVNTYAGRLFAERVKIDGYTGFEALEENADLEGRDLHRFAYDLARFTIRDGLRFILVEAPEVEGIVTKADEVQAGIRPYFIEIDRRAVLGWKTENIGAQKIITQFRMLETVNIDGDEFSQKLVEQIRVIEPNLIRLYRKSDKGDWMLYETINTSTDFVPIVPVYSDRQGHMFAPPALMDLAWLNVEHWQKSSDQSNILHVARVPILHWIGYRPSMDEEGKTVELTIGPNTLAKSASENAKLEYVEHSGAAIGAGRQDLIDIENRMVALGAEFVTPNKSGDMTATEKAINESGDISELSAFAQNLKDSLTNALKMAAKMMGGEFTGELLLNTKLGIMTSPVNVDDLIKIRALGDISREGMFELINDEWGTALDPETEADRLDSEPVTLGDDGGFEE